MSKQRRRGRVNLAYINEDSLRKVTFKKRTKGLFKKLNEVTTLCDVKACAVVYDFEGENGHLYPEEPMDVLDVVSRLMKLSVTEQQRKMYDQESYLNERISKTNEQVLRLQMDSREKRLTQFMYEFLIYKNKTLDALSVTDLEELSRLIDQHLRDIEIHIQTLRENMFGQGVPLPAHSISVGPVEGSGPLLISNVGATDNFNYNNINWESDSAILDQWFMEILRNPETPGTSGNNFGAI